MKKTTVALLLAAITYSSCSNNTNNKNPESLVVATENTTIKYQCPMKCEGDTSYTTEGQCPVCGMDLEKL